MARIAFFHPAFEAPGGAEILCLRHALAFREQGDESYLVTLAFDPEVWNGRLEGVPVRLARYRGAADALAFWSRRWKLVLRGRRAAAKMRDADVAVAHNHPCNAMLGSRSMRARRVWQCNEPPRRIHARDANPRLTGHVERLEGAPEDFASELWQRALVQYRKDLEPGHKRYEQRRFDREMTRRLDHVYAISEFSRDIARSIYGRCGDDVVYPVVRFPARAGPRRAPEREALRVLVHTRLEVLKNVDTAVRGFACFRARHPGARLEVVGDGPMRTRLEALAAEALPDRACRFHGYLPREELDRVYADCDVLLLPTLDEPFGMVYPEAAARGLLLVGPDHGGPFEILEGGRLGWCVDPFDPDAIAQALEEVAALSGAEADHRRAEADRSCRARFSAEAVLPRLRRAVLSGQG